MCLKNGHRKIFYIISSLLGLYTILSNKGIKKAKNINVFFFKLIKMKQNTFLLFHDKMIFLKNTCTSPTLYCMKHSLSLTNTHYQHILLMSVLTFLLSFQGKTYLQFVYMNLNFYLRLNSCSDIQTHTHCLANLENIRKANKGNVLQTEDSSGII